MRVTLIGQALEPEPALFGSPAWRPPTKPSPFWVGRMAASYKSQPFLGRPHGGLLQNNAVFGHDLAEAGFVDDFDAQ
jgi:hypothetical protein